MTKKAVAMLSMMCSMTSTSSCSLLASMRNIPEHRMLAHSNKMADSMPAVWALVRLLGGLLGEYMVENIKLRSVTDREHNGLFMLRCWQKTTCGDKNHRDGDEGEKLSWSAGLRILKQVPDGSPDLDSTNCQLDKASFPHLADKTSPKIFLSFPFRLCHSVICWCESVSRFTCDFSSWLSSSFSCLAFAVLGKKLGK